MSASSVTDEELAAVVVALFSVLAGRAAGAGPSGSAGPSDSSAKESSLWRDRTALIGAPLRTGAGAWRASGLPR